METDYVVVLVNGAISSKNTPSFGRIARALRVMPHMCVVSSRRFFRCWVTQSPALFLKGGGGESALRCVVVVHPHLAVRWRVSLPSPPTPTPPLTAHTNPCPTPSPTRYRKNCKRLFVVFPTMWIRSALLFLRSTVSKKFWRKMVVVESVRGLYPYLDPGSLLLPRHVMRTDAEMNALEAAAGGPGTPGGGGAPGAGAYGAGSGSSH